ncbi:MAG: hypothetical protein HQL08_04490 [Nitrospirae bacterium]|nr:hypothetical protein [Nitrospirota bacterium]
MADVKYKDYTPEESMIYEEALTKIREGVKNGLSFSEACSKADVQDAGLKEYIEDDALKIMIAEMHYQQNVPLQEIADKLKISLKKLVAASMEMLEDVGTTAAEAYREENPDSPIGHA